MTPSEPSGTLRSLFPRDEQAGVLHGGAAVGVVLARKTNPSAVSMNDAAAPVANSSLAPAESPGASRRLAIYYALVVTQAVSLIGSQISEYAVGIAVFRATGHATPLALVAFFSAAPAILLGGFAGALADRFDRRRMMLIANIGFTVVSGLLLLSFASGAFRLWHLYALTLGASLFAALDRPAFQASVAMLVPDSHRDRANAIRQVTGSASSVIAPAFAGMLYALVGVVGSIAIDIASFIAAIAVLAIVRIRRPAETGEGLAMQTAVWRQAFDGFRYLAARPVLLGFCGYVSMVNFFANTALVLLTPYVLARTGSAQLLGVVLAVMNAGGIAGALIISVAGRIGSRMNTVMLGIVGFGLFIGLAGVAHDAPAIGASLFLVLFALTFTDAPFWSIMQAKIAPDLQGRVFAAHLQVAMLMAPLAFLVAGPLADRVFEPARHQPAWQSVGWLVGVGPGAGMGMMFVVAGTLILALSLAVNAIPAVRRLEADLPDHAAAAA
jgi:DHA3 family macrolide efflux protein-like MFS transporter